MQENAPLRPMRSLLIGALVLFLTLMVVAAFESYRDLTMVQAREAELQDELAATEDAILDLEERIVGLREDPAILERLAREELGMMKPGEVVILLPEDAGSP
ncbi:MAG: septum formation initiator family protein [Acidobacteriota bacterium]